MDLPQLAIDRQSQHDVLRNPVHNQETISRMGNITPILFP